VDRGSVESSSRLERELSKLFHPCSTGENTFRHTILLSSGILGGLPLTCGVYSTSFLQPLSSLPLPAIVLVALDQPPSVLAHDASKLMVQWMQGHWFHLDPTVSWSWDGEWDDGVTR
jgi:hypothetical protein